MFPAQLRTVRRMVVSLRLHNSYQEEVTMQTRISKQVEPALAFTLMKIALQVYEKMVVDLTLDEYAETYQYACHEMTLHEKILLSEAACGVVIPDGVIAAAFDTLVAEHGGEENFFRHLEENNLQLDSYLTALRNDLTVETTLARVASRADTVSDQEIQDYYHRHRDLFCFPQQRRARHILFCTENHPSHLPKEALRDRINRLHSRLQRDPQTFSHEAKIHSDCTTAIDGGDLGQVGPGELCPALDHALFQLGAGEISPIIETAEGFHILFCEAIHPGQRLNLQKAQHQIHQILTREKRIHTCRNWLKSLFPNLK